MLGVTLDCDDIVLINEPRTYRLIENIMSTVAECFTSRRIHIGMDEETDTIPLTMTLLFHTDTISQ